MRSKNRKLQELKKCHIVLRKMKGIHSVNAGHQERELNLVAKKLSFRSEAFENLNIQIFRERDLQHVKRFLKTSLIFAGRAKETSFSSTLMLGGHALLTLIFAVYPLLSQQNKGSCR